MRAKVAAFSVLASMGVIACKVQPPKGSATQSAVVNVEAANGGNKVYVFFAQPSEKSGKPSVHRFSCPGKTAEEALQAARALDWQQKCTLDLEGFEAVEVNEFAEDVLNNIAAMMPQLDTQGPTPTAEVQRFEGVISKLETDIAAQKALTLEKVITPAQAKIRADWAAMVASLSDTRRIQPRNAAARLKEAKAANDAYVKKLEDDFQERRRLEVERLTNEKTKQSAELAALKLKGAGNGLIELRNTINASGKRQELVARLVDLLSQPVPFDLYSDLNGMPAERLAALVFNTTFEQAWVGSFDCQVKAYCYSSRADAHNIEAKFNFADRNLKLSDDAVLTQCMKVANCGKPCGGYREEKLECRKDYSSYTGPTMKRAALADLPALAAQTLKSLDEVIKNGIAGDQAAASDVAKLAAEIKADGGEAKPADAGGDKVIQGSGMSSNPLLPNQ